MTAQILICRDLAKNGTDLKKIEELFLTLQASATPASLLLPWFPSPARKRVKRATIELFTMFYTYVKTGRNAEPTSNAIDVLIADGGTTQDIASVGPIPTAVRDFVTSDPAFLVCHVNTFCWHH
jgi:hypothetical protein